uniref:Uncharacterized protein n=1 Tax=Physcomitrium patens TaxID=3218 RepID=A0A2K1JUS9_PHYPA|nr:hypothetical protein PHYPA_015054 [Physcomitrium patens]
MSFTRFKDPSLTRGRKTLRVSFSHVLKTDSRRVSCVVFRSTQRSACTWGQVDDSSDSGGLASPWACSSSTALFCLFMTHALTNLTLK